MPGEDSHLIIKELRAQTKWLRLIGMQQLRAVVAACVTTEKQRAVFELSDGKRTAREVAKLAGVGVGSVSRMWSRWITLGVCSESELAAGRAEHLISLSQLDLGVVKPTPPQDNDG